MLGVRYLLLLFSCLLSLVWLHGPQPARLSMGFPRQEYWSRLPLPSPGDPPNPGMKPRICPGRRILYHWATKEVLKVRKVVAFVGSMQRVWDGLDVLFLDLGAGYMGMFVLWQSTELYTYDWCNFLYICMFLSCNKIYKKCHNSSFLRPYTPRIIKF